MPSYWSNFAHVLLLVCYLHLFLKFINPFSFFLSYANHRPCNKNEHWYSYLYEKKSYLLLITFFNFWRGKFSYNYETFFVWVSELVEQCIIFRSISRYFRHLTRSVLIHPSIRPAVFLVLFSLSATIFILFLLSSRIVNQKTELFKLCWFLRTDFWVDVVAGVSVIFILVFFFFYIF